MNIKVLLGLKERGYRIKKSIGERVYTVRRQRGEATILEYDHAYLYFGVRGG